MELEIIDQRTTLLKGNHQVVLQNHEKKIEEEALSVIYSVHRCPVRLPACRRQPLPPLTALTRVGHAAASRWQRKQLLAPLAASPCRFNVEPVTVSSFPSFLPSPSSSNRRSNWAPSLHLHPKSHVHRVARPCTSTRPTALPFSVRVIAHANLATTARHGGRDAAHRG